MTDKPTFFLDAVETEQSPLQYAVALQKAASSVGFDWPDISGIISKIHEETDEVAAEIAESDHHKLQGEIGDLLFAITNLARHLNVDPLLALQQTNQKFYKRFNYIETQANHLGKSLAELPLIEMDKLWEQAKTCT